MHRKNAGPVRAFALAVTAFAAFVDRAPAQAGSDDPFALERVMADPDWIARSPSEARWSLDGERVRFARKLPNSALSALFEIDLPSGEIRPIPPDETTTSGLPGGAADPSGGRVLVAHRGCLFLYVDGAGPTPLLVGSTDVADPVFLTDPEAVAYRRGDTWIARTIADGFEVELVRLVAADDPEEERRRAEERRTALARAEERLFEHVARARRERNERFEAERAHRSADPYARQTAVYLGKGNDVRASALSPDGRTLAVRIGRKEEEEVPRDLLPEWVGETGYVTARPVRPNVGTRTRGAERLVLVDAESGTSTAVDLAGLPGATAGADGAPDVRIQRFVWSTTGERLAAMVRALDDRRRWIVAVDRDGALRVLHEIHDEAWVNHAFNEFGWLPDARTLWYLSEETGFAHLFFVDTHTMERRQVTEGEHENDDVVIDRAGRALWWRSSAGDLASNEVWSLVLRDPDAVPRRVTSFGGRLEFEPCPRGERVLVTLSYPLGPPELFLVDTTADAPPRRLTRTVEPEFSDLPWVTPSIVAVPSRTGRAIPARLFEPPADRTFAAGSRPAVLFVHGAGYLQQAHRGWSYYFRETLFHTLLARRGAVVLEPDYRASAGYGRDWRVAIHGGMGGPELDDLEDCVEWLVSEHGVDRERVGVYGGSYGGFLTLQALFVRPRLFACGAALRPVTDWAHYSHGYTAPILGLPEEHPENYRRSSPIEHAAGLERPLLITHGLVDDNVLPKDSIRLVQRLIELGKRDFELALYPVEPHGFRSPASWTDQYRRILGLFERHLDLPAR